LQDPEDAVGKKLDISKLNTDIIIDNYKEKLEFINEV